MTCKKTRAIGWCLMGMLTSAALAAEKEAPVFEADFSKATYAPVPEASLAGWKSQGWKIQAKELPSSWVPSGADGFLDVLAEKDGGRFLRFKGQLRGPAAPIPSSGWVLVQVTLRNGSVTVSGPVYGGDKGGQIGGFSMPNYEAGSQWTTPTFVYHFKQEKPGGAVLNLYAPTGTVDVRGIQVIPATGALDAYRKAYSLIRSPMVQLVKNGGLEETRVCLPEELRQWRDDRKWNLGEGDRVILPAGFGPHPYPGYNGNRLRLIDDPAQSHNGSQCVEFTLMAGGGFTAKPDKVYLVSCWARGKGKLIIFGNLYGGPAGGFLGNTEVTGSSGAYDLVEQWAQFQTTVPLKKEGYSTVGVNPVFVAEQGAFLDDFAVFELETDKSLLEKIGKAQKSLNETLTDQIQLGPRQREMLKFLADEAEKLRARCSAGNDAANLEELVNRVEALGYVTAGVKSEMEFGDTPE